jgi:hypothetical protein
MFSQAGLRFDTEFLNRVFFSGGSGTVRVFYFNSRGNSVPTADSPDIYPTHVAPKVGKPNFIERWIGSLATRILNYSIKKILGIETDPTEGLHQYSDVHISRAEASAGGEKEVVIGSGPKSRRLMVKIPRGVSTGTRIRLRGMGKTQGHTAGDLYLIVKVEGIPIKSSSG